MAAIVLQGGGDDVFKARVGALADLWRLGGKANGKQS